MVIITYRKEPKTVFTSKFVGVMWHVTKKKWRAAISIEGSKKILGYFNTELEAALAYNAVAAKFGRPVNFIEGELK
jgi:hypothetical protein